MGKKYWQNWKKGRDFGGITRWKSISRPKYTVEIVSWRSQNLEGGEGFIGWGYGYNAINGRGTQSSPHMFHTKKDALKWAIKYMKNNKW